MEIAIIVSKKDIAGMNIKQCLLELFDFKELNESFDNNSIYEFNNKKNQYEKPLKNTKKSALQISGVPEIQRISEHNKKIIKLYTIENDTIYFEDIDKKIEAELFIFATRHSSKEKVPSLSCHVPGNWGKAEFGGKERQLCIAPASILKSIFLELNKLNNNEINITLECTHHGPYLEKPCCFVEIGSSEEFWRDKKLGEIISKTIINVLNKNNKHKVVFGIGGPHYCNNFNKILSRTDIALGHICPKYALEALDEEMIKQAIEKTQEKVDFVLLDWKGFGQYKQKIVELFKKLNIKYERTDQIK